MLLKMLLIITITSAANDTRRMPHIEDGSKHNLPGASSGNKNPVINEPVLDDSHTFFNDHQHENESPKIKRQDSTLCVKYYPIGSTKDCQEEEHNCKCEGAEQKALKRLQKERASGCDTSCPCGCIDNEKSLNTTCDRLSSKENLRNQCGYERNTAPKSLASAGCSINSCN